MVALKNKRLRIQTDRFEVVTLQPNMVDDTFMEWVKQRPIQRQFPDFAKQGSVEKLRTFIEQLRSSKWDFFIIRERTTDRAIGFMVVTNGPSNSVTTHHALGDRRWWGKGVIHEARAGLIETLFQLGVHKIVGLPRTSSRSAVRTYLDQGFVQEGILRDRYRKDDGTYEDAIAFGLLREDWNLEAAKQMPEAVQRRLDRMRQRNSLTGTTEA